MQMSQKNAYKYDFVTKPLVEQIKRTYVYDNMHVHICSNLFSVNKMKLASKRQ